MIGPSTPPSDELLVEHHDREERGQVNDRREEEPAGALPGAGFGAGDAEAEEREAEHDGGEEVEDAGHADQRRDEAHGDEPPAIKDDLLAGGAEVFIDNRQHLKTPGGVVVAVE